MRTRFGSPSKTVALVGVRGNESPRLSVIFLKKTNAIRRLHPVVFETLVANFGNDCKRIIKANTGKYFQGIGC